MANTQVRIRSPKGNVGVTDVVDAGELSAYSQGALSGFGATSAASFTIQIGGSSSVQDVAVGKNPAGESELFVGTSGTTIPFIIGGAPGTPGQSRTDALVLYKDPFTTSVVNNGLDVTDYAVVAGTAATTGTQVPPNDAAIRAAIPTGSLKFVAVIGYVTIAQGASSVTTGNFIANPALSTRSPLVVATQAARDLLTLFEGLAVYRADTDATEIYDGTEWLSYDSKWQTYTPTVAFGVSNITVNNGTLVARYKRSGKSLALEAELVIGSTTSIPSAGTLTISTPFTLATTFTTNKPIGSSQVIKSAVSEGVGYVQRNTTTKLQLRYSQYGAVANPPSLVTNTAPFTAGTADTYSISCPNLQLA